MSELPLSGSRVVIAGELETMNRHEAHVAIFNAGGKPRRFVSERTDWLVLGRNPDGWRIHLAELTGAHICTERWFREHKLDMPPLT